MVKILNGEIVQDDDPRLQQRHDRPARPPAQQGAATQAAAGSTNVLQGFSSGFDFSAPAVKVVPRPDAPGGIPDVELFALRVPGTGLLGVAAAGAFFGLKGLLAAALLGYLYLRTSGGAAAPRADAGAPSSAGQRGGGAGSFFMQQQQQQQQQQSQDGFSGGLQQRPGQGGSGQASSAFRGKAYKLGGS